MEARAELTRNQQLVLERLEKSSGPLSAYALLDELREQGFRAPLQVYRALDRLMKAGLVHRLESLNSFVACTDSHTHANGMTAFAICENCGTVAEFADPVVGERLEGRHRIPRPVPGLRRRLTGDIAMNGRHLSSINATSRSSDRKTG